MKGKGLLLLILLIAILIIGYLNIIQRNTILKKTSETLSAPIRKSEEIPNAVKNQVEDNLQQAQNIQEKNIPKD